jgi:hypothetical protein
VDESLLRQVAREARGRLAEILGDEQRADEIGTRIDDALALPTGEATWALFAVLSADPELHRWALDRMAMMTPTVDRLLPDDPPERGPIEVRDGDGGDGGGQAPTTGPVEQRRFLQTQMPERVETGRPLSLRVVIALDGGSGATALEGFAVPSSGATVTVVVSSPGLIARGDAEADIEVPADRDSQPHRFSFTAGRVGSHPVLVEAYRGGTHLGTALLQLSVEQDVTVVDAPVRVAELSSTAFEPGEVTLQVRNGPDGYHFQVIGDTLYGDVPAAMGDVTGAVAALAAELRAMAADKTAFGNKALIRERVRQLGIGLWAAAVPQEVQEQFWDQHDRIKTFTIAADNDTIPWELLYPRNGDKDDGFLADQFPVVRRAFAKRRVLTLPMDDAGYVVPPGSPANAVAECTSVRTLLGARVADRGVVSSLADVTALIRAAPGMIHFACHNGFSETDGSTIAFADGPWRPSDLSEAAQAETLTGAGPLVFLNACRSAGEIAWFSEMNGWAQKFVKAGAGAFIGSLWAVRSSSARTFAEAFYTQFVDEAQPLGAASLAARRAIADDDGDPTWLAYTVYGNPAASVAKDSATNSATGRGQNPE